jgi:hypothetical protein
MDSIMNVWNNRETGADIWNDVLKQTKRDQYAKEVGRYTGELNSIIAKRDADVLSLEGQGRGIPEVIIGGQQAQINREAAIRALPVQAMLATAQGNLEMANQQLTQLYQIRMADATAQTNFQLGVVNSLFDFADKKEQRQFEAIQADITRKYEEKKAFEATRNQLLSSAIAQGAPRSVVDGINNATTAEAAINAAGQYNGDILARQAQAASLRASNASAALNEAELKAFNKAQEDAAKGILTPDQQKDANTINEKFTAEPIVKTYNEMLAKQIALEGILENGVSGVQDLTLVYEYMKALDPNSVVREAEFDNAAASGNIFAGAFAKFNKGYFGQGGFLPENVKQSFIGAIQSRQDAVSTQYFNVKSEYGKRVNNTLGIQNGADYLTAYEGAAPLQQVDFNIATTLSTATPEEIDEIMTMTNTFSSTPMTR